MWTDIQQAFDIIEQGGLILYPTDTIWGIGCDALNEEAIRKVYRLKQRSDEKSLIILLAEPKDIFHYVAGPPPDIISLVQSFQRPTTLIYEQAIGLPEALTPPDGSIAIRITRDAFSKTLIKKMKRPLISTSANLSGMPPPANFSDISNILKSGVDYVVQYRQEEQKTRPASDIFRIDKTGELYRIR